MEVGDENCSDVDGEDEENETPQFILKGPEEVNISNSTGVTVGSTLNVNLNVNQMLVHNDIPSVRKEVCSTDISGLLNSLMGKIEPVIKVNSTSRDCSLLPSIPMAEPSTVSEELQNVEVISCSANRQSPNLDHVVNENAIARGKSNIEVKNNELQNTDCSYEENASFTKLPTEESNFNYSGKSKTQDVEEKMTVYSLIKEFVDDINDCLKHGDYIDFKLHTITNNTVINEFKLMAKTIKVKGLAPLIPRKEIDVDISDNLLFVSIPLKLEHLQLTFEDFSIEWEKMSFKSNLKIDVDDSFILLNLSTATNEHRHLVNDVSFELCFESIQINFDTNLVISEMVSMLVKKKIKAFFEKYSKTLSHKLKTFYTDIAKNVLQCNDVCTNLFFIYGMKELY